LARVTYSVPGIDCQNCVQTIQRRLGGLAGVSRVEVDAAEKRVAVEYDPQRIQPAALSNQLEQAGFPAEYLPVPGSNTPAAGGNTPAPPRLVLWFVTLGVMLLAAAGYAGYVLYPRFNLPAAQGAALLLLAAGAGVASFFSPCSFPLLVTLLARHTGRGEKTTGRPSQRGSAFSFAAALSLGAAAFLILSGLVIAVGGEALFAGVTFESPTGRALRTVVGGFLILLGLMQLGVLPFPLHAVERIARPLLRTQAQIRNRNPLISFTLFGFGYLLAGFG
jgi:copper chaperone CopZ/cytochrome c biogenesis protein CcdA